MKDHSFNEVVRLDRELYELAYYDVTKGMLMIPKDQETLHDLEQKAIAKFNYFKKTIQNGECTYDFIRCTVLSQNGPFSQAEEMNTLNLEDIQDWESEYKDIKKDIATTNPILDFVNELLNSSNKDAQIDFVVEPIKPTEPTDKPKEIPPKLDTLSYLKNSKKKKTPKKD